jgi:hypothetical protein
MHNTLTIHTKEFFVTRRLSRFSLTVVCAVSLACAVSASVPIDTAPKSAAAVDTAKKAEVQFKTVNVKKWIFSYAIDGKNLVAKVSYPTKGWVAIGFNPKRKMAGANMVIGKVSDKGVYIQNHYGTAPTEHKPKVDLGRKDCISDGNVTQNNGVTTVFFTIPLNDGDPKDPVLVPGQETTVIFAAGDAHDITEQHFDAAKTKLTL